jgi:hypothetical protein
VETELESKLGEQQQMQQLASISSTKFKTAFEKIDSLLQLTSCDRLAIIGNRKYSQILVTRLCVNALLSSSSKKRMNKREADFFTRLI